MLYTWELSNSSNKFAAQTFTQIFFCLGTINVVALTSHKNASYQKFYLFCFQGESRAFVFSYKNAIILSAFKFGRNLNCKPAKSLLNSLNFEATKQLTCPYHEELNTTKQIKSKQRAFQSKLML